MKTTWFLCLIIATTLNAQIPTITLPTYIITSVDASYQLWNAGKDYAQQVAIPFTVLVPIGDNLRFDVSTAPAFSNIVTGGTAELGGMSDTRLSALYMTSNQKLLFTFGVNTPTGKSALDPEEFSVANVLAIHALDFQVPTLGQGLDFSVGVSSAHRLGGFVIGAGAGFLSRGAFDPFADLDYRYDPGDEEYLSLGLDRNITRHSKLMLDAVYTIYTPDMADGEKVYKAGNRFTLQTTAYFPGEFWSFLITARNRIQEKNEQGTGALIPERKNSNGDELDLNTVLMLALSRKTMISAAAEGKIYSDNDYGNSGAKVIGFGGGFKLSISSHLTFDLGGRYYLGRLNTASGNVKLIGLKVFGGFSLYL